ncbi:hypothetical protein HZH66_014492 [Vespula vulgaris]|uniref:Uncharacterized protein n=1 Tax=Vespula vulgaris TaxID=7454 RepID=A0A834J1U9_VESVU|nr:hypothetical protein HZH66_014492 [Vespula vulgaris]
MNKKKEMLRMLRRYILKRTSLSRDSNEEERRLKVRRGSNGSGRTGPQRKRGISTFREDRRVASFVVRNDETDGIPIGKWTEPTMGFFNVSRKYGNLRNSKAMKRKRTLVKLSPAANANSFFYTG